MTGTVIPFIVPSWFFRLAVCYSIFELRANAAAYKPGQLIKPSIYGQALETVAHVLGTAITT